MELQLIQSKIFEIRGCRVMLDFHLAQLYGVTTKALKQAVKRNEKRFPNDFRFTLTSTEWRELVTVCDQIPSQMKHSYILPDCFTEQGVAMISSVLRSDVAIEVNISIMRAFVEMRQYLTREVLPNDELRALRDKIRQLEHNDEDALRAINDLSEDIYKDIDNIYTAIAELSVKPTTNAGLDPNRRRIGFNKSDQ